MTISCSGTNATCNGGYNGSALVTIISGIPSYTYIWSNGSTNSSVSGLIAGTYTVTVTDGTSATGTCSYTITQPVAIAANCSGSNVCNGNNNGSVSVTASNGSGAYTYSWSNGTTGSVILGASKDNTLYQLSPNNSNGEGEWMFAGQQNNSTVVRALMKFDLSSIPAGAIITGVSLRLNCTFTSSGAGAQQFNLYKIFQDWGEGTSNAGGPGGTGTLATANDATWIKRIVPSASWNIAGGDFSSVISGSSIVNALGFYTWASQGMTTDIQSWLNNPSANFGWLLKGLETANLQAKRFDTRENATPSQRPLLTVNYTVGPSTASQSGLTAGIYSVIVTDQNGCTGTCSYTISNSPYPPATITPSGSVSFCPGGSVQLLASTGSGFSYLWSDSSTNSSIIVSTPGNYTVQVTNSSGCTAISSVVIVTIHTLPSDVDKNGITDVVDFLQFLGAFNTSCTGCPEDIDNNGIIDVQDFLILLGDFNESCS
ncbi:MAG: DNRLRE domain-containing protein [Bacteroidota bacterium]